MLSAGRTPIAMVVAMILLLTAFAVGCGGDSDESSGSEGTTAAAEESTSGNENAAGEGNHDGTRSRNPGNGGESKDGGSSGQGSGGQSGSNDGQKTQLPEHEDTGGGSEQFRVKGGDNSVQGYGQESQGTEFEEASDALHTFLDARLAGEYDLACEHLSTRVTDSLAQFAEGSDIPTDCPSLLRALTEPMPRQALRHSSVADVGSVRTDGDTGFVMYRGAGNEPMFIPIAEEDGQWKVASLGGAPLG